jgi:(2R)-3-sulfolactate dehydrogenase (NADP+)
MALANSALRRAGATDAVAEAVADSIASAEADGIRMIGLAYLPVYCRHLHCQKVDGRTDPVFSEPAPGLLLGDVKGGFCHAAFAQGEARFAEMARTQGIAAFGLSRSYASGVLGWFVERMADRGLMALAVSNASPTMAPPGGAKPIVGTNPIALAVPRSGKPALVIDFSPAATTRLEIKQRRANNEAIPLGWGLDGDGAPTTDPAAVLDGGTVAPAAGHKGFALALLVELLAAGLTGSRWSFEASDLGNDEGGPPGIGQLFIAIDPTLTNGDGFGPHIEKLAIAMLDQPGVRLPGERRLAHRAEAIKAGVSVDEGLLDEIEAAARGPV